MTVTLQKTNVEIIRYWIQPFSVAWIFFRVLLRKENSFCLVWLVNFFSGKHGFKNTFGDQCCFPVLFFNLLGMTTLSETAWRWLFPEFTERDETKFTRRLTLQKGFLCFLLCRDSCGPSYYRHYSNTLVIRTSLTRIPTSSIVLWFEPTS